MSQSTSLPVQWAEELAGLYKAGVAHAFCLSGLTLDYVGQKGGLSLHEFLFGMFASPTIKIRYSRSGMQFESKAIKSAFTTYMENLSGDLDGDNIQAILGGGGGAYSLPTSPQEVIELLDDAINESLVFGRRTDAKTGESNFVLKNLSEMTDPEYDAYSATQKGKTTLDEDGFLWVRNRFLILIEDTELIFPSCDLSAMSESVRDMINRVTRWGRDISGAASNHVFFLLTESDSELNQYLQKSSSRFERIFIPAPSLDERIFFIEKLQTQHELSFEGDLDIPAIGRLTAGLGYKNLEDIFLRAGDVLTRDAIRVRKAAIIQSEYGAVLEAIEPTIGFNDIGGHTEVRQFVQKAIIDPLRTGGDKRRIPMGLIFGGPPGTGKSLFAKALAKECGLNMVRFDPSKVFGRYVGDSERNLAKALQGIKQNSPSIVFIDEMDQVLSRSTQGSGPESRVFGRILEFIADPTHRGEIIFVGATNRIDLIDDALRRPGRFDQVLLFAPPSADDRKVILSIQLAKQGIEMNPEDVPADTITETDGMTGAELELIAMKAVTLSLDGMSIRAALVEAPKRVRANTGGVDDMVMLTLKEVNDLDLVPPKYRAMIQGDEFDDRVREAEDRNNQPRGRRSL